jgi:hypothetical protein
MAEDHDAHAALGDVDDVFLGRSAEDRDAEFGGGETHHGVKRFAVNLAVRAGDREFAHRDTGELLHDPAVFVRQRRVDRRVPFRARHRLPTPRRIRSRNAKHPGLRFAVERGRKSRGFVFSFRSFD